MARTTATEVKKILTTALSDEDINNVIEFSNRQVTEVLSGESLTAAVLKDIETWLTAHLIAMGKERETQEERVGDVWLKFQEKRGESLRSTNFGQMVLMLDSSGKFQQATKQKTRIRAIKQINI